MLYKYYDIILYVVTKCLGDDFILKRLAFSILFLLLIAFSSCAEPQIDGRYILFGHFEQDDNISNGSEPIEWLVLSSDEDTLWLLSRYGLFPSSFHSTDSVIRWNGCSLRKKLNNDFYNSSFSESEKECILLTHVTADRNTRFRNKSGKDTDDYVYLLSMKETDSFFPEPEDKLAWPTPYAAASGCYVGENGTCGWWTRTVGHSDDDDCSINSEGLYRNFQVNFRKYCIRPVIRIDAKKASYIPQTAEFFAKISE